MTRTRAKVDYYEILCVERTVSDDELKKAYRRLAVQYHPDRNPGNQAAEEKFKELSEAYAVLSDKQKRATYDRFGHAGLGGGGFGGFEGGFGGGGFSDIFDNIFGDIFGGGAARAGGVDLRYHMEIDFREAAFGVEKEITFGKESKCGTCSGNGAKPGTQPLACGTCQGSGQIRMSQGFFTIARTCPKCQGRGTLIHDLCETCHGSGRQKTPHKLSVTIPAGIDDGQRLRLRGEGEVGEGGGQPGDLYVEVSIKEHPLFKRQNEHIILEMPITFVQASLGASVQVPTLDGSMSVKIPAGTQHDELIRLRGKGIKRLNGSGFGDEVIRILVETPTRLSGKQKELLKQFERAGSEDSHPGIARFLKKFKDLFQN